MKPRPHHELRILHALGHEIEYRDTFGKWGLTSQPSWDPDVEYRVHQTPEQTPDIVATTRIVQRHKGFAGIAFVGGEPNLSLTFDGTTGELKSADVLKPSE